MCGTGRRVGAQNQRDSLHGVDERVDKAADAGDIGAKVRRLLQASNLINDFPLAEIIGYGCVALTYKVMPG